MATATPSVKSRQNSAQESVQTGVDMNLPMTCGRKRADYVSQWQSWIDGTLREWLRDPSQIADDGVEPPTDTIIRLALDLAEQFRDGGYPPPNRIVPDPNGGIVFERSVRGTSASYHIWDDGKVEYLEFLGTRLVSRVSI